MLPHSYNLALCVYQAYRYAIETKRASSIVFVGNFNGDFQDDVLLNNVFELEEYAFNLRMLQDSLRDVVTRLCALSPYVKRHNKTARHCNRLYLEDCVKDAKRVLLRDIANVDRDLYRASDEYAATYRRLTILKMLSCFKVNIK